MALVGPILSIIFGILVLAFPGLLRWIVGLYFVIVGIIGLLGYL
jgi:hypothetical protein